MEEGDLPDPGQLPEADEPQIRLGEVGADHDLRRRTTVVPPYPGGPWVGDRSQPETGEIQLARPLTSRGFQWGGGPGEWVGKREGYFFPERTAMMIFP